MRNAMIATLVLAPALLQMQAQTPAQTRGTQEAMLGSKLVSPAAAPASPSAIHPISILVQPKLIKWSNLEVEPTAVAASTGSRSVTVSMNVSTDGVPTDLKIVSSDDPLLNSNVLKAVSAYRFSPAMLNAKPTAMPLILKVNVRRAE